MLWFSWLSCSTVCLRETWVLVKNQLPSSWGNMWKRKDSECKEAAGCGVCRGSKPDSLSEPIRASPLVRVFFFVPSSMNHSDRDSPIKCLKLMNVCTKTLRLICNHQVRCDSPSNYVFHPIIPLYDYDTVWANAIVQQQAIKEAGFMQKHQTAGPGGLSPLIFKDSGEVLTLELKKPGEATDSEEVVWISDCTDL